MGALGIGSFLTEHGSGLLGELVRSVADGSEPRREPPLRHHLHGQLGGTREVAGRSGRGFTDDQVLRGAPAQADGEGIEQVALGVEVSLIDRELLGDAERPAGGQDRDLGHRVGVLGEKGHERVP